MAAHGAKVVINDPGTSGSGEGSDQTPAQEIVDQIKAAGGEAAPNYGSVAKFDDCLAMVQQALGWVTPGDNFEDEVTNKIVSITQSWMEVACMRVEPVMAMGPVVRFIFSMRASWITSRLRSTVSHKMSSGLL